MALSSDHRTAAEQWLQNNKKKSKSAVVYIKVQMGTGGQSWKDAGACLHPDCFGFTVSSL